MPKPAARPFADLIDPIAGTAAHAVDHRHGSLPEGALPAARAGLADHLAGRITELAAPLLFDLFDRTRPRPPVAARLLDATPPDTSRTAYDAFITRMARGGWAQLCADHPQLGHGVDQIIRDGIALADDVLRSLAADRDALGALVHDRQRFTIARACFGLSDPHGHGRSVVRLDLGDGGSLAWKPRGLGNDAGFAALGRWVEARIPPGQVHRLPAQRFPALLDRGSHGWMAWVTHSACADTTEVEAFFRRLGGLTALLHLLRGSDIHDENLIAVGPYPVIVDLECLFAGRFEPDWLARLTDAPAFMASGILPVLVPLADGIWRNMGCGGPPLPAAPVPDHGFRHIATDWMRRATVTTLTNFTNLPVRDGMPRSIRDHTDAFVDSYRLAMETVWAHRDAFTALGGPLAAFDGSLCRLVALPTESYRRLLVRMAEPDLIADPAAIDRQAARIDRPAPTRFAADDWARLRRAERDALDRRDVPAFLYRIDGRYLTEADGRPIGRLGGHPPLDLVTASVRALSPVGIARDCAILRQVFDPPPSPLRDGGPVTIERLADHLAATALRRVDGGVDWLRPHERPPISCQMAGHGLLSRYCRHWPHARAGRSDLRARRVADPRS
ncbi:hypothetical protein GCM10011505_44040 [Tistrella bauzanensis]|uniref:Lantibiotic biosynthesis protein dehydration domain-containing protein n=1 Tax=Tistrella bauzanensis TaxID=657419 RepID=A0ABQ1J461_9PROT|nr:hypothetical protein GCM10011505_44040 [Tistrella bauzanensis]